MARSKLTAKQLEVALLLAAGKTITEAAKQAEAGRQTIHSWLRDDDVFIAYLNELKSEIIDAGRSQVHASVSLAILAITDILQNSINDTARLAAAKEILFMSGLSRELKIGATTAEGIKKAREEAESFDNLWS